MIGREKLDERMLTTSEVRDILEERQDKDVEMLYETKNALEHAQRTTEMDSEEAKEMVDKLTNEYSSIDEKTAVQIVNLSPKTKDDLKVILHEKYRTPDEEEEEEILDLLI